MNRYHRAPSVPSLLAAIATTAALAVALSSCGTSSTDRAAAPVPTSSSTSSPAAPTSSGPATPTTDTPSAATVVISIKDFMFEVPASVAPGAMITVKNEDTQAHTVTSKNGGFDVKVFPNDSATLTAPKTAGSYELTCDFHANMKSNLVVK